MKDAAPDPAEKQAAADVYLREARALRAVDPLPDAQAPPHEVHGYLLDVRRRLDRLEQILALATRARALAKRTATEALTTADEAWDEACMKIRTNPVRRGDEYSSARERAAEANLACLSTSRAARRAAESLAHADELLDVLRLLHKGLDGVRQDTLTTLRLVQFESHLER